MNELMLQAIRQQWREAFREAVPSGRVFALVADNGDRLWFE